MFVRCLGVAGESSDYASALGTETPRRLALVEFVDLAHLNQQLVGRSNMGVEPKIRGKSPKMDGENHGNPIKMGWFWGKTHYFWKHPHVSSGCSNVHDIRFQWFQKRKGLTFFFVVTCVKGEVSNFQHMIFYLPFRSCFGSKDLRHYII